DFEESSRTQMLRHIQAGLAGPDLCARSYRLLILLHYNARSAICLPVCDVREGLADDVGAAAANLVHASDALKREKQAQPYASTYLSRSHTPGHLGGDGARSYGLLHRRGH